MEWCVRLFDNHKLLWDSQTLTQLREVSLLLALLLAQARPEAFSGGVAGLIAHSGGVARAVLVTLLIFSLVSWAIIVYKGLVLHRARAQSDTFLRVFRKSTKFSEVNSVSPQLKASPLVGVFQAGYVEVNQQVRSGRGEGERAPAWCAASSRSRARSPAPPPGR